MVSATNGLQKKFQNFTKKGLPGNLTNRITNEFDILIIIYMAGKLFLISAPSGAGKTTLVNILIERYGLQYNLNRIITYTSKVPRPGEIDGVHYHFISTAEFEKRIQEGFFMEWSGAYQAFYGSPASIIDALETGQSYVLILDRVGTEKVLQKFAGAVVPIWIYTKSVATLRDRLLTRNTDNIEVIERRLRRAHEEITLEITQPIYTYHLMNHDLKDALDRLVTIIKRELFLGR